MLISMDYTRIEHAAMASLLVVFQVASRGKCSAGHLAVNDTSLLPWQKGAMGNESKVHMVVLGDLTDKTVAFIVKNNLSLIGTFGRCLRYLLHLRNLCLLLKGYFCMHC